MPAGDALLGRVIDGLGQPIDGAGPLGVIDRAPLRPPSMNPLDREPVAAPIGTGVRAIDKAGRSAGDSAASSAAAASARAPCSA
ncbi:MAG: hypothetical protein R2712_05305 [Vicinamibacterales bacterium]